MGLNPEGLAKCFFRNVGYATSIVTLGFASYLLFNPEFSLVPRERVLGHTGRCYFNNGANAVLAELGSKTFDLVTIELFSEYDPNTAGEFTVKSCIIHKSAYPPEPDDNLGKHGLYLLDNNRERIAGEEHFARFSSSDGLAERVSVGYNFRARFVGVLDGSAGYSIIIPIIENDIIPP